MANQLIEGIQVEIGDKIGVSLKGKDYIFKVSGFTANGYPKTRMSSMAKWGIESNFPQVDGMVVTVIMSAENLVKFKKS